MEKFEIIIGQLVTLYRGDEPIRIPGAEEFKAPAQFREELMEGMKCKSADPSKCVPEGFQEMVERYTKDITQ